MNHLITGATGFLGKELVRLLLQRYPGDKIFCVSRTPRKDKGYVSLVADLRHADQAAEVVRAASPDRVYHLAGESRATGHDDFPARFEANFLSTQWLLDALEKSGKRVRFFLASSVHVYGNAENEVKESSPLAPGTSYAFSKYLAETAARAASSRTPAITTIVGRLYTCIGPGQAEGFVLSDFCRRLAAMKRDGEVLQTGSLSATRSFIDARDAAIVIDKLCSRDGKLPAFEVFNLASGNYYSMKQLLDELLEVSGKRPVVESRENMAPNGFLGLRVNTEKLKTVLHPEFRPLRQTLQDTWKSHLGRA